MIYLKMQISLFLNSEGNHVNNSLHFYKFYLNLKRKFGNINENYLKQLYYFHIKFNMLYYFTFEIQNALNKKIIYH